MTAPDFTFWLGTHEPSWLSRDDVNVPLMVSHNRLKDRRTFPSAIAPWIQDSGGFTELQRYGADAFPGGPRAYVKSARRYQDQIGRRAWYAPQDWMCEPVMISGGRVGRMEFVGTKLSVPEHQYQTVTNGIEIRQIDPGGGSIYVLQGFTESEYWACLDLYDKHDIDLTAEPVVGLGSVCRRNRTGLVAKLVRDFRAAGINVHVFGAKGDGVTAVCQTATSADSLAWSTRARNSPPMRGCSHGADGTGSCANCPRFALAWRKRLLERVAAHQAAGPQLDLFGSAA